MERYFIAGEKSEYKKALDEYIHIAEQQRKFINIFFQENNIKANEYRVGGTGFMNESFNEDDKNTITLSIVPTDEDIKNFNKILCKRNKYGLQQFKKSCKIAKNFAQQCIDNQIPINLWKPRIPDYFQSLAYGLYGCSYEQFKHHDKLYLKVDSKYLTEDDTPNGFVNIKASEFYVAKEQHEKINRED